MAQARSTSRISQNHAKANHGKSVERICFKNICHCSAHYTDHHLLNAVTVRWPYGDRTVTVRWPYGDLTWLHFRATDIALSSAWNQKQHNHSHIHTAKPAIAWLTPKILVIVGCFVGAVSQRLIAGVAHLGVSLDLWTRIQGEKTYEYFSFMNWTIF